VIRAEAFEKAWRQGFEEDFSLVDKIIILIIRLLTKGQD